MDGVLVDSMPLHFEAWRRAFEKENISEINISNHPKSKIFDLKLKKDSPDRVLKSMENLITDFELKLHHEKDFISNLLHKKNYYDIK